MANKTIEDAIKAINPEAAWVSTPADDADGITWTLGTTPIPKADLETKKAELQAIEDALEYSRNRETAYPDFKEFAEAYTEKEIGEDSTKWDAYVTAYNKARSDNPKE